MINVLTPEQEASIPAHTKKWLDRGLSTTQVTQERATAIVDALMEKILNRAKVPVILVNSPLEAWKVVYSRVCNSKKEEILAAIEVEVEKEINKPELLAMIDEMLK